MTPELRKEASELQLHKRGIRINLQLPLTESNEEVTLRTPQQLWQRMQALYAVMQAACADAAAPTQPSPTWPGGCSAQERAFLADPAPDAASQFGASAEALYFLAWCGGLVDKLPFPGQPSNLKPVMKFCAHHAAQPQQLPAALTLRGKNAILGWSDLLYRLHWSARHAHLTGRATPAGLDYSVLCAWHRAVNWLCRYDDEDNWDRVGTET